MTPFEPLSIQGYSTLWERYIIQPAWGIYLPHWIKTLNLYKGPRVIHHFYKVAKICSLSKQNLSPLLVFREVDLTAHGVDGSANWQDVGVGARESIGLCMTTFHALVGVIHCLSSDKQ